MNEKLTLLVKISQKMKNDFGKHNAQITIKFYFKFSKNPSFGCLVRGGCLLFVLKIRCLR